MTGLDMIGPAHPNYGEGHSAYQVAKDKGYEATKGGNIVGPKGGILKLATGTSGYKFFSFRLPNGKHRSIPAHQYVVWYFIGDEAFKYECIRHLDGDRSNNSLENLKPGTTSENFKDNDAEWRTDFARKGASLKRKLTDEQVTEIKGLLANKQPTRSIATKYGVARSTIQQIKDGRSYAWIQ